MEVVRLQQPRSSEIITTTTTFSVNRGQKYEPKKLLIFFFFLNILGLCGSRPTSLVVRPQQPRSSEIITTTTTVGISRGQQHQKAISNLCLGWRPLCSQWPLCRSCSSPFFTAAVKAISRVSKTEYFRETQYPIYSGTQTSAAETIFQ